MKKIVLRLLLLTILISLLFTFYFLSGRNFPIFAQGTFDCAWRDPTTTGCNPEGTCIENCCCSPANNNCYWNPPDNCYEPDPYLCAGFSSFMCNSIQGQTCVSAACPESTPVPPTPVPTGEVTPAPTSSPTLDENYFTCSWNGMNSCVPITNHCSSGCFPDSRNCPQNPSSPATCSVAGMITCSCGTRPTYYRCDPDTQTCIEACDPDTDPDTQTCEIGTYADLGLCTDDCYEFFTGSLIPLNLRGSCPENRINTAIGCIPVQPLRFVPFITSWAIGIAGGIAFLLMLYAGFTIITSSGDPQRLQGGKELLTAAISGLLLIIFSIFILRVIGIQILAIPWLNP
jgi:hypothetical protein